MAYSRWLTSIWYTYWHVGGGHIRDTQPFEICAVKMFTYKELNTDIEKCLQEIRELVPEATEEQIQELKGYMQYFLKDVKSDQCINYYEDLQNNSIKDPKEFLEWLGHCLNYNDALKNEFKEALTVLCSDEPPLLIGTLAGNLGKLILEKRLKGTINKQTWPMEKIIY